jgi:hypothetical protein
MKREHSNDLPMLLPLGSLDIHLVLAGMHREAEESAKHGDELGTAKCYQIIERLEGLSDIDNLGARQALAALGIGSARGRPQG